VSMEILSYPGNYRVWKSRIVAEFNGVRLPEREKDVDIEKKENRTDAFLHLNPFGQVPTLKLEGNQGVFESNSIARYMTRLGESSQRQGKKDVNLYGSSIAETSRIDAFLDGCNGMEYFLGSWGYKIQDLDFTKNFTPEYINECQRVTKRFFSGFEQALKEGPFFVGNSITLADIVWWC